MTSSAQTGVRIGPHPWCQWWVLAWRYLWSRPLVCGLNMLLLTLGITAMGLVTLVAEQIDEGLRRDLAHIDLVVGAKGSPMQIMLSGVFHLDVPTGNIPLETVDLVRSHALVASVTPLSLGDSLRGHRIVGTTPAYADLYGARLAQGRWWAPQSPALEVVLGSEVAQALGLRMGDRFSSTHGLGHTGEIHEASSYEVVGLLHPTHAVIDRLILTATESVWAVHETASADNAQDLKTLAEEREVTMLLVRYRSPLAAVSLPPWVNAQAGLQAASPALETARLLRMVGVGIDVLKGLSVMLLTAAGVSVFIALFHAVREREPDLLMMRLLGAPPRRLALLVSSEALLLALISCALGIALSHGLLALLSTTLSTAQSVRLSGTTVLAAELWLPLWAVTVALVASVLPIWRVYRLDVSALLQGR